MTELTPEQMAEIRERALWGIEISHSESSVASCMAANSDRRALLAHIDAQAARTAELEREREEVEPEQPEAGRGEAVAVVHDDDSGGHWVELTDDVKDGDLLYLAPPATAEAVRLVAAFRGFWVTNESGMLERCVATIDAIEKACRDADAFLAQHGGRGDE